MFALRRIRADGMWMRKMKRAGLFDGIDHDALLTSRTKRRRKTL